ncbi:MAG TPA: MarR family transcriptional regulator [Actinoplanes sp.]
MTLAHTRWLSEHEDTAWRNLTRILVLLPGALDRQLRDDAGLTHVYYQILAMLSEQPDNSMRMTDLARLTGTTTSRLSHAVASLEQRGWVERRACATDKRGQIARLTETGMTIVEEAAPGHVTEVRRLIFDHLTPEDISHLQSITGKIMPLLTDGPGQ